MQLKDKIEDLDKVLQEIKHLREALTHCTEPTTEPGPTAYNELFALRRFADRECEHAPWLLNIVQTTVRDKSHYAALPGGFFILALLLDIRGERLTFGYLQSLTPELRDQVRQAFRTALK